MFNLGSLLKEYDSLYLLDLSWHLHKDINTFSNFGVDIDGYLLKTGHYYGLYRDIKAIMELEENPLIVLCQDGRPAAREELMEESGLEYKEGRPELDYNFYKDVNKIKAIFCTISNVVWAYNEDKESDDIMFALAKQAEDCSEFKGYIYIYSGDNDLLQSADDRISVIRKREKGVFRIIDNTVITSDEQFTKKFHGVDSYHIVDFRSIIGDSSDKIPGIPRFPRDIAVKIAMNKDFTPSTSKEVKWYKIYEENKSIVDRNRNLMQLSSDFEVNLTKPNVNKEKVSDLLSKLKLTSLSSWLSEKGYL